MVTWNKNFLKKKRNNIINWDIRILKSQNINSNQNSPNEKPEYILVSMTNIEFLIETELGPKKFQNYTKPIKRVSGIQEILLSLRGDPDMLPTFPGSTYKTTRKEKGYKVCEEEKDTMSAVKL